MNDQTNFYNLLRDGFNDHQKSCKRIACGLKNKSSELKNLLLGMLSRSFTNYHAFSALFAMGNFQVCFAIMRMQLDIVAQLFLLQIVEDQERYASYLMSGEKFNKYQDANIKDHPILKNNINTTLICKAIDAVSHQPWALTIFQTTSEFIHPSNMDIAILYSIQADTEDFFEKQSFIPLNEEQKHGAAKNFINLSASLIKTVEKIISELPTDD